MHRSCKGQVYLIVNCDLLPKDTSYEPIFCVYQIIYNIDSTRDFLEQQLSKHKFPHLCKINNRVPYFGSKKIKHKITNVPASYKCIDKGK